MNNDGIELRHLGIAHPGITLRGLSITAAGTRLANITPDLLEQANQSILGISTCADLNVIFYPTLGVFIQDSCKIVKNQPEHS